MPEATFREASAAFLAHHRLYHPDTSTMRYQFRVLNEAFGDLPLAAVTTDGLEAFFGARVGKVTNATMNRNRAALSVFFNWAISRGYRPGPNPARSIRKFSEGEGRTRYPTPDEFRRLLLAASAHLRPLLFFIVHTGARRREALTLTWRDIDFDGGLVTLARENTKGRKTRHIPMTPALAAELRALRPGRPHEPVFQWNGCAMGSVKRAFATACRKAKIEGLQLRDLRHGFATFFIINGGDIRRLKELLGHSDIKLTLRYAHLSQDFILSSVQFIGPPAARKQGQE